MSQLPGNDASNTRILGIDPGLNITGYGVLDVKKGHLSLVEAGVIRSNRSDELGMRLASIHDGVLDVVQSLRPNIVSIEELYSHYERPKTAIIMGHARGAICLAVTKQDLAIKSYAASQIKKVLTGNGRAPKPQVQLAVGVAMGFGGWATRQ